MRTARERSASEHKHTQNKLKQFMFNYTKTLLVVHTKPEKLVQIRRNQFRDISVYIDGLVSNVCYVSCTCEFEKEIP